MTNQAALAFFNFNKNSVIQISGYTAKKGATSLFVPGSHTEYCLCYLTVQRHILPGIPGTEPASSTPAVRHPQQSFLSPRRPRDPGASTSPLASRDLGPQYCCPRRTRPRDPKKYCCPRRPRPRDPQHKLLAELSRPRDPQHKLLTELSRPRDPRRIAGRGPSHPHWL